MRCWPHWFWHSSEHIAATKTKKLKAFNWWPQNVRGKSAEVIWEEGKQFPFPASEIQLSPWQLASESLPNINHCSAIHVTCSHPLMSNVEKYVWIGNSGGFLPKSVCVLHPCIRWALSSFPGSLSTPVLQKQCFFQLIWQHSSFEPMSSTSYCYLQKQIQASYLDFEKCL